jgi:hypothetical protein
MNLTRFSVLAAAIGMMSYISCASSEPDGRHDARPPVRETGKSDLILSDYGKVAGVTGNPDVIRSGIPCPNETDSRWNVGGTDLGIIWEISPGTYGLFFGDTYGADFRPVTGGGPGAASDWRSNVLAFSSDTDLDDGLSFDGMLTDGSDPDRAVEIIPRTGDRLFTSIPTAAVSLDGKQYVHYMYWQVGRDYDPLNYSSIYSSEDGGRTWTSCRDRIEFGNDSNFGMVGYAKKDGWCYMIGTHIGRSGSAYLARFRYGDILDKSSYEFWNGTDGKWVKGDEKAATVLIDGTVGELSFVWLEEYGMWLVLYFDSEEYAICYRSAEEITGPWSVERVLVSGSEYSQLYGSYIHPHIEGNAIYYTMSQWVPYNVFLMKAGVSVLL